MKFSKMFIVIVFIFISAKSYGAEINFADLENHWAKESIIKLSKIGAVSGYLDNTFKPNNNVRCLEFVKILSEVLKIEDDSDNKIWPDYYIKICEEYGIDLNYYDEITRYEATQIISKLLDIKKASPAPNKFKDLKSSSKTEVLKLVKLNIINGYEDNTFRGDNKISRAEASVIALRVKSAKEELIANTKFDFDSRYTNYKKALSDKSGFARVRYDIKNNKILFSDAGRYAYLENFEIDEKYVSNKKIISIAKSLLSSDGYLALYYVPSKYVINQIKLDYGQNDNLLEKGLKYFGITYYEDKLYDLERITLNENFNGANECYMNITINKMCKDFDEFTSNNIINKNIKKRLFDALEIEFSKDAEKIIDFMMQKYESNDFKLQDKIAEKEIIGNNIIYFYQKDEASLEFYFEKL